MDESLKHNISWKNLNIKEYMMYDFDFIKTGKPSLYRQVPGFTTNEGEGTWRTAVTGRQHQSIIWSIGNVLFLD